MITFKEHQFHDGDNTVLYIRKESRNITIIYVSYIIYNFIPINIIFHFMLQVSGVNSDLLDKFYQTGT
jgi:hypothetical protein